jgi:hypothetical protein
MLSDYSDDEATSLRHGRRRPTNVVKAALPKKAKLAPRMAPQLAPQLAVQVEKPAEMTLSDSDDDGVAPRPSVPYGIRCNLRGNRRVLDLYAGSCHLAHKLIDRGFDVVSYDVLIGKSDHDLSSYSLFKRLRDEIAQKKFVYIHAGPPCATFSQARYPKIRSVSLNLNNFVLLALAFPPSLVHLGNAKFQHEGLSGVNAKNLSTMSNTIKPYWNTKLMLKRFTRV